MYVTVQYESPAQHSTYEPRVLLKKIDVDVNNLISCDFTIKEYVNTFFPSKNVYNLLS